jgi:hypothetical protein
MSPDLMDRLSSGFGVAAAGLAIATAITGGIAWYFTDRSAADKDERFKRFQEESRVAISSSDARAADAMENAAKAHERTATLEKDATDARLELEKIKERQSPRILTQEQRRTIFDAFSHKDIELLEKTNVWVGADPSDAEAVSYARQIAGTLICKSTYMDTDEIFRKMNPKPGDIVIPVGADGITPVKAALFDILNSAKIGNVFWEYGSKFNVDNIDGILIGVGAKNDVDKEVQRRISDEVDAELKKIDDEKHIMDHK